MSPPWMPLYIADYRADTAHLSAAEHGAYLLLIMHYWTTGGLPGDDRQLARIACMTTIEWKRSRGIINGFFHGGWKHKRIDGELSRAAEVSSAYAARASKAANKRWTKDASSSASSTHQALHEECLGMPISPSPSEAKASASEAPSKGADPPDPEADLFRRGREVLGKDSGGLVTRVLKARGGKIPLARAVIETAATKHDPREWVGGVVRGREAETQDWRSAIL